MCGRGDNGANRKRQAPGSVVRCAGSLTVPGFQYAATIAGFKQPRQAIVFTRDGKTAYVLNEDLSISKVERAGQRIVATVAAAQAVAAY